jgi:hypothetical protein
VFNFRTKATPVEPNFRSDWQWSSSASSSTITRVAHKNKIIQKIFPCVQDDFSSSLARSKENRDSNYPPRIVTADYRKSRSAIFTSKPRKSRRNSLDNTYESADFCEKGDMLERVRSIGSLGSAPTLVDSKDFDWKYLDAGSPMSNARRISSPPMSPISPLDPCRLRESIGEEDEIYPFP